MTTLRQTHISYGRNPCFGSFLFVMYLQKAFNATKINNFVQIETLKADYQVVGHLDLQ